MYRGANWLTAALFIASLSLSDCDMCRNSVMRQIKSPDRQYQAVIFERDCGATSDFSTQISIIRADKSLRQNEVGNIFRADSDHGAVPVDAKGLIAVDVQWVDKRTLSIAYPAKARVFSHEPTAGDVAVRYSIE